MSPEHDKMLVDAAPGLYSRESLRPAVEAAGLWGFECGDGWFALLLELSKQLETTGAIADQVKEKFGGLRFYYHPCSAEADAFIREAEKKALKTCDVCGKPGTMSESGWMKVRCEDHK